MAFQPKNRAFYEGILAKAGMHSPQLLDALLASEEAFLIADDVRKNPASLQSEQKEDDSVVTLADTKIQKKYETRLIGKHGGLFLGEENGGALTGQPNATDDVWNVDPVDGTTNYANGVPNATYGLSPSCTSIGMSRGGEPYLGVVRSLDTGLVFFALKDKGAYLLDGERLVALNDNKEKPLTAITKKPSLGFGHIAHEVHEAVKKTFQKTAKEKLSVGTSNREYGCVAWELCLMAAGHLGAYVTDAREWDYAAGLLIAKESGAHVHLTKAHAEKGEKYDTVMAAHTDMAPELQAALDESLSKVRDKSWTASLGARTGWAPGSVGE